MAYEVLIVDDEADIRTSLSGVLEDEGYLVRTAASGQEALDKISAKQPDMVLLDIWMEGMDGLETLSRLKRRSPDLPVVMISGHGTIETAVQATQKGAYDFIEKPPQVDRLLLTIDRAIRDQHLRKENARLRSRSGQVQELLGASSEIARVRHMVKQVAKSESRIMLSGESGTGKEVVARLIHAQSNRNEQPFFVLSPAVVTDATFDLSLYSLLDNSTGGTLFIDEIADLTSVMQAKLLRFLQDGTLEDPHSGMRRSADLRVITASSRRMDVLVESKEFKAELYYRLNVVPVDVPPLRVRTGDIPSLVDYFISVVSPDKTSAPSIQPAAMAVLTSYNWPGNVRQLRNLVEWLTIMHPGKQIAPEMLPADLSAPQGGSGAPDLASINTLPLRQAREIFERTYLTNQLVRFGGNISRTADFVGMERSALHRKLKSLGVETRDNA